MNRPTSDDRTAALDSLAATLIDAFSVAVFSSIAAANPLEVDEDGTLPYSCRDTARVYLLESGN